MKSFTDINQSKILAKILPLKSADMCYGIDDTLKYNNLPWLIPYHKYTAKEFYIPCWSLSALLEAMPVLKRIGYEKAKPNIHFNVFTNKWVCNSLYYTSDSYDNPIDAAFEMICWLKENGKI